MTQRVLVLGGTGMLGHKLVQVLAADPAFEVHATVRRRPMEEFASRGVDYHEGITVAAGDPSLATALGRLAPDVVINAVGAIKQRKELMGSLEQTFFLNATLPHLLPLMNPNPAGRVVHFSTDCVFQGDRGGYRESDAPDAEDAYGRSKASGELTYGRHLTIRTSIIGFELASHLGLVGWLFGNPRGARLTGFGRAIFSGLPTCTLARQVRDLLHHGPALTGVYHVASEPISKLDLISRLNEAFGTGYEIARDDAFVLDRSLDDSRFRAATGTRRPDWATLVAELERDFRTLPYETLYPTLAARSPAASASA